MKKREFDVLGILLGLVIGGLLGFFISTRIKAGEDLPVIAPVEETIGFVYLVETDKFDNPTGPINYINQLTSKGFNAVAIKKSEYYHIYCGVFGNNEDALNLQKVLEEYDYNVTVNKEYLLDATNHLDSQTSQTQFYNYAINCLINNLNNQKFEIDNDMIDLEINTTLMSDIIALNVVTKDSYISKLRLQIYKNICESLK